MTAREPNEPRKIVPRWHSLWKSSKQGEISASTRSASELPFRDEERQASLAEHLADWAASRTLAVAEDFVSAALVLGAEEAARDAAEYVLSSEDASSLATAVARRIVGADEEASDRDDFDPFDVVQLRRQIARLKHRLRNDPRAALTWAEIARAYAALGQARQAADAMFIALSMAPEDRFLLRSASRLSLHLGEPDRAHSLLTSSAQLRNDPWLLSAEIAIAPLAGRTSRNHGHARRVLESGVFLPHATSELASALGTEALAAGDSRRVRRLLAASLEDPTENAVAQAEWVSRQEQTFEFDRALLGVADTFEARAHFFARERQDSEALDNARAWLREQPFAKAPAIFGSYRAALVKDYAASIQFARAGLQANPSDYMLINNLVFALASAGQVAEARAQLDALLPLVEGRRLENQWSLTVEATKGLVSFREGDIAGGRKAYLRVIAEADDAAFRAVAAILWAREEAIARTRESENAVRVAREYVDAADDLTDPRADDISAWLEHVPDE